MRFFLLLRSWIIGILLAAAAVFFGYQTYQVWSPSAAPETGQPAQKPPKAGAERKVVYRRIPRYNTYEVIAQKDLFSSDRRETLPETPQASSPVKASVPLDARFVLFGIVIDGDEKKALVANFNRRSAEEKEYIWVKVGDKIGNLNVSEIEPEQIVITQGSSTFIVRLSDQSHPQKRSNVRKAIKPTEPGIKNIKRTKDKSDEEKESKSSS